MTSKVLQILTYARHSWPLTVRFPKLATTTVTPASVYNCHLRGSVTISAIAERLSVVLPLPVFMSQISLPLGFEHRGECSDPLSHRCGLSDIIYLFK